MPAKPALGQWDASTSAACGWSLAVHLLLVACLAWHNGPAFDSGGGSPGSGCVLNTAWSEGAEDRARLDEEQPVDVRFVEMVAAVPVPEPAPPSGVFPAPAPAPAAVDAQPASAGQGPWPAVATEVAPHAGPAAAGLPEAAGRRFFSLDLGGGGGGGAEPLSVVFVIDQSASMNRHHASDVARRELLRTLNGLSSADRFQIVLYNTRPTAMTLPGGPPQLLRATDRHRTLADDLLRSTVVDGGTDHMAAIEAALRLQPETIVLLTDGDEPRLSARDLATIRRWNRRQTAIHAVQFGVGPQLGEASSLAILASDHGGTYSYHDILGPVP